MTDDDDFDDDEPIEIDPPRADGSIDVQQIPLLTAIWAHLAAHHGDIELEPRQMNATVKAANLIVAELRKPVVRSTAGMGIDAWWRSDDTGMSSQYLAATLEGIRFATKNAHPKDPADFGRCLRMLEAAPELRANLPRMAEPIHGPVWNRLYEHWDELEALYREELPSGMAPRCDELMRKLIAGDAT